MKKKYFLFISIIALAAFFAISARVQAETLEINPNQNTEINIDKNSTGKTEVTVSEAPDNESLTESTVQANPNNASNDNSAPAVKNPDSNLVEQNKKIEVLSRDIEENSKTLEKTKQNQEKILKIILTNILIESIVIFLLITISLKVNRVTR